MIIRLTPFVLTLGCSTVVETQIYDQDDECWRIAEVQRDSESWRRMARNAGGCLGKDVEAVYFERSTEQCFRILGECVVDGDDLVLATNECPLSNTICP